MTPPDHDAAESLGHPPTQQTLWTVSSCCWCGYEIAPRGHFARIKHRGRCHSAAGPDPRPRRTDIPHSKHCQRCHSTVGAHSTAGPPPPCGIGRRGGARTGDDAAAGRFVRRAAARFVRRAAARGRLVLTTTVCRRVSWRSMSANSRLTPIIVHRCSMGFPPPVPARRGRRLPNDRRLPHGRRLARTGPVCRRASRRSMPANSRMTPIVVHRRSMMLPSAARPGRPARHVRRGHPSP
jgi:hypothetical protein